MQRKQWRFCNDDYRWDAWAIRRLRERLNVLSDLKPLEKTGRIAVAQTVFHEKESLVAVPSFNNRVVMHFLYFANEVRDFGQIPKAEG